MNARTTWFLLGLAALLFAGIMLIERPIRREKNQKPDTRVLPDLKITSVSDLQIRPAGKFPIRLSKTNDTWQLTNPVNYPANAGKILGLLRLFTNLTWQAHITAQELRSHPKADEEFGFDTPQFSIVVQERSQTRHLLIGKSSVMGDQIYLQVVGADGIYIADTLLLKVLPQKPDDWRDPKALPASAAAANSLEVRSSGKNFFRLELNPTNNLWRMTRPLETRANTSKVDELLTSLFLLSTREFVADDANLDFEKFGLPNTPAQNADLELLLLQGTNLLGGLQIGGSPTNAPDQVFARRVNYNAIFLLPKTVLEPWWAPSTDFRDRRLIDLSPGGITNIEVWGADHFTLQRKTNGAWNVTEPEQFEADPQLVQNELLLAFDRIEMNFENDVVTDFAPFGLDTNLALQFNISGVLTNSATGKTVPTTEQLSFGATGTNRVFVRRGDAKRVFSVTPQEFEVFPRASWQLRDRRIWNFSPDDVVAINIEQQGKTRKLIRKGTNDWIIASGTEGPIDPLAIEGAMTELGELKAVFWTKQNEPDRAKFGFKEMDFRFSIELKNGKTESIELGSFSPFGHPYGAVQRNGQRTIFEFPLPIYFQYVRKKLSILPLPDLPIP
jgi:hypothetical protein